MAWGENTHQTSRRLVWHNDNDFNNGLPVNVSVVGSGDSAKLTLASLTDNDDDIGYENIVNYSLSDSNKITIQGGNARLKQLSGDSENWPFTTPSNYTYDSSLINITSGKASLKDLRPSGATFYCNYTTKDGNWGEGVLTGTLVSGATVSSGQLDISGASGRSCDYDGADNVDAQQTGCVRFGYIPQYTGSPTDYQVPVFIGADSTNNNAIYLFHDTTGDLFLASYAPDGSLIMAHNAGAWSPTSGVEYEFEFNWDLTAGASRLFIDGVQKGTTATQTGVRNAVSLLRLGNTYDNSLTSAHRINYILVFDAVQHTSDYTPQGDSSISNTIYSATKPTIDPDTSLVFTSPLQLLQETSTKPGSTDLQYQVSVDNGTTYKYWSGSAWINRTTTATQIVPTSISTVAGTHDSGDLSSIQTLDGTTYDISELSSAPPVLRADIGFTTIPQPPTQITVCAGYDGNLSHTVNVDIYNFQTSSWDTLGQIPDNLGIITQYNFTVTGTQSDYLDTNGDVDIRINHTSNGNSNHDLTIDYIYLLINADPSNEWYNDNEANSASVITTNFPTLAASGTFTWKGFLSGTNQTPELDFLEASTASTFSTDDNLYIDTTNSSQVAPSTVVEWLTSLVTNTLPANTDIKLLVSVDGRSTWLTWGGSNFTPVADPTLRSNAMSISTYENNFALLSVGSSTLDIRLFLYSSDNTTTPAVSNINIVSSAGFATTGLWTASVYDSGYYSLNWGPVTWSSVTPAGTSIIIKMRAGNTITEVASNPFTTIAASGDDAGIVGRIIQVRIEFTGLSDATSELDLIEIAFNLSSEVVVKS